VQDDVVSFGADLVSVTTDSISDAVRWVRGLGKLSAVNHLSVCDTLNSALKLAAV